MKSHHEDRSLIGVCEAVGGRDAFRRISWRFHEKIEHDPALRGLFPKNMASLEERFALYLLERTGGPADYSTSRGKTSLVCRHAHLAIGTTEAKRWLAHLSAALAEEGVSQETAALLLGNLTLLAEQLADPFVLLYALPLEELRERFKQSPSLLNADGHGRSLIHAAATAWDVPRLRLLLEFGAEVGGKDAGGHTPLYRVANGQGNEEVGREAVGLLIAHGAEVNQRTGVGGMTPLHMSARRGTTQIAEALLEAGADIEARDKSGETVLRRAVNCGQTGMVGLLLRRGADPLATDNKGKTPRDAARNEDMRRLLET